MTNIDSVGSKNLIDPRKKHKVTFNIVDDEKGKPIDGVTVSMVFSDKTRQSKPTIKGGTVTFFHLPAGTCDLASCVKDGYDLMELKEVHTLADKDTLLTIARSHNIMWQDLAAFNWGIGCRDEKTAAEYMRDLFGCRDYNSPHTMEYRVREGKTHTIRIPKKVERKGLALDTTHKLRLGYKPTPPQFVACEGIPNITFDYSLSLIRPFAEKHLVKLKDLVMKNPGTKLMIFGHTDLMKDGKTGKELSERRAKSAFAMLTRQTDDWVALYKEGQDPDNEHWGVHPIQVILNYLNPNAKLDLSGYLDDRTLKEIETYAKPASEGSASGHKKIPDSTLKIIFKRYMDKVTGGLKLDKSRFVPLKHAGCSCFNPVIDIKKTEEENRRVTFFLFDTKRLPVFPCSNTDTAPCKTQSAQHDKDSCGTYRNHPSFRCAFYDSIAKHCDAETEFPDIIAIDGHMHFMTGHATPLPLLWGQVGIKIDPRSRLDALGRNLKWVGMGGTARLAGTAEMKTEAIAEIGFKQNNSIYKKLYSNAKSQKPGLQLLTPMIAMPMDMSFAHIDGYKGAAIYTKVLSRQYYCKVRYSTTPNGEISYPVYAKVLKWPKAVTDVIKDAEDAWFELAPDEVTEGVIQNAEENAKIHDPAKEHLKTETRGNSKQIKEGFYYYLDRKNEKENIDSIDDKEPFWMHWEEMDMFVDWDDQMKDTIAAALKYPFQYIPMYHYEPRRWKAADDTKDYSDPDTKLLPQYPWGWNLPFKDIATAKKPGVFIGFKMYSALGYRPQDYKVWGTANRPNLPNMKQFYGRCEKEGIPVLCHCSPGGVFSHDRKLYFDLATKVERREYGRLIIPDRKKDWYYDHFVRPEAWVPVLKDFPKLKLCLAHFGGDLWEKWHASVYSKIQSRTRMAGEDYYMASTINEDDIVKECYDTKERDKFSWIRQIVEIMEEQENGVYVHPNFFTDISYHFMEKHHREFLWLIINHPIVKERVMFGTDWYMTENDKKSIEDFVSEAKSNIDKMSKDYFEKTGIYEDLWMMFSRINPMKFYGLRSAADNFAAGLKAALAEDKTLSVDDKIDINDGISTNLKIIKESDL